MHRLLATILAFLTLALSIIPCADADACPHSTATETYLIAPQAPHSDSHTCGDLCSPFCSCACCAAIALPVSFSLVEKPSIPFAKTSFSLLAISAIASIALPVWQPPQLG